MQPGWQVAISTTPLARPLVAALAAELGRHGAYPIVRLGTVDLDVFPFATEWAEHAPTEALEQLPSAMTRSTEELDARVIVFAPEAIAAGSSLAPDRRMALRRAGGVMRDVVAGKPWVSCPFPTEALAGDAGISLAEYTDVFFDACLRDWDAEGERMRRFAERFEHADEVRIVAPGTDVRMSVAARTFVVDDAHVNMPGGEFFTSPVEGTAEGVIEFSEYATALHGHRCEGVRLRFERGAVVEASARVGEEFLLAALETDEGARNLGELGIGCNEGIPKHVRQQWFDEKVAGTCHLALGQGFEECGGSNLSALHWDLVKDLAAGRIELDGETVQAHGRWLI